MRKLTVVLVSLLAAACAPGTETPLRAEGVVVTPEIPGMPMRAAYLTLVNNSDASISISSVSSPQFEEISMHETLVDNDVARMRPLAELVIARGEEIRLEPGGKHLMLSGPKGSGSPTDDSRRRHDGEMITLNLYSGERLVLSITTSASERSQ